MPWNKVLSKMKAGTLHSGGPGGPVVRNRRQGIAIMLSEKRKAEGGKTEYQAKSPAHQQVRRLARPSSYANGGTVQRTGLAMVHAGETVTPKSSPIAMRNAAAWNTPGGGYDQWKAGDPQRERSMPVGAMLPKEPMTPEHPIKKLRPKY